MKVVTAKDILIQKEAQIQRFPLRRYLDIRIIKILCFFSILLDFH